MKFLALIFLSFILICDVSGKQWKNVKCLGSYLCHLQGIDIANNKIYWSYTTKILRTNSDGTVEKITDAPNHQGDCCFHNNKLYVAVNLGKFNAISNAKNFVYIYDSDLNFEKSIAIDELEDGLGGIEFFDGHFYMVGGCHKERTHFKVAKYTSDFKLVKIYEIPVGESTKGAQTICRAYGKFWLGCYIKKGEPKNALWVMDDDFNVVKKFSYNASVGLAPIESEDDSNFMLARCFQAKNKYAKYTADAVPIKIELN